MKTPLHILARALFCAAFLFLLSAAAHGRAEKVTFLVAVDGSASVPQAEFDAYKRHAREMLALTRPGDVVVVRRLEDAASLHTVVFAEDFKRHGNEVVALAAHIAGYEKRTKGGQTLFQPVIDHLRAQIEVDRTVARKSDQRRYVLVVLSDGEPDDRAAKTPAKPLPLDVDWQLLVLGVHDQHHAKLQALLAAAGFGGDAKRCVFVPYAQLDATANRLHHLVGREHDERLRKLLAANGSK